MPPERTAKTYSSGITSASKAVLLEVAATLRAYRDALVLLGDERMEWLKDLLRQSHKDEQAYHDAQIKGLNGRYAQLQQRLDQIYLDKLDGKVPTELWEQKSAEWRREQDEVRTQLGWHQGANQGYMEEGIRIFELAQRFVPLYDAATPDEKQQILRFLLLNCTLNDATPTPVYRKPFNWFVEMGQLQLWRGRGDLNPRSSP